MHRIHQFLLLGTFLPFCWLAFQVCHESGHVLGAWLTGGTVTRVVVHPLALSRTDVAPNPNPLVEIWSGPLVGVLLPFAIWGIWHTLQRGTAYLARFLAGFCAIANGAYLGIGSFERIGDAGDLIQQGLPAWALWIFGAVTIPLGFAAWHGLGPAFGWGGAQGRVDRWATYLSLALFAALFLLLYFASPRA